MTVKLTKRAIDAFEASIPDDPNFGPTRREEVSVGKFVYFEDYGFGIYVYSDGSGSQILPGTFEEARAYAEKTTEDYKDHLLDFGFWGYEGEEEAA